MKLIASQSEKYLLINLPMMQIWGSREGSMSDVTQITQLASWSHIGKPQNKDMGIFN